VHTGAYPQSETIRAEDVDEAALAAAMISSRENAAVRRSTIDHSVQRAPDALNPHQEHPAPRSQHSFDSFERDLQSLLPMTSKARSQSRRETTLRKRPSLQSWAQDPYNNVNDFRFVTWWHIFNVQPLTKYEVVARINQQLVKTNTHFASNQDDYTINFVFGGATFYNSTESAAAGWVCDQPSTYRAKMVTLKPGSRFINTVVCNRGDQQMGESSFPYDTNGQAFASGEDDPRHVMQIDPEALAGGAYGSDSTSSDGDASLEFQAPVFSHLLGHLFGLPHTFQDDGKCPVDGSLDNDASVGITDTPVQELPYPEENDCRNPRQGDCGKQEGYKLNNIMGHALCADSFTEDQSNRMGRVAIEYHTRKAARQDCESNPCSPNTVCRQSRTGLFGGITQDGLAYVGMYSYRGAAALFLHLFLRRILRALSLQGARHRIQLKMCSQSRLRL